VPLSLSGEGPRGPRAAGCEGVPWELALSRAAARTPAAAAGRRHPADGGGARAAADAIYAHGCRAAHLRSRGPVVHGARRADHTYKRRTEHSSTGPRTDRRSATQLLFTYF
jgi:hypothetical protein